MESSTQEEEAVVGGWLHHIDKHHCVLLCTAVYLSSAPTKKATRNWMLVQSGMYNKAAIEWTTKLP